jgi:hypothetical protein
MGDASDVLTYAIAMRWSVRCPTLSLANQLSVRASRGARWISSPLSLVTRIA